VGHVLWSCCDAWYKGGDVWKRKLIGFSFCILGFNISNMKISLLIVGEECPCNQIFIALSLK
jgi:hypothetical protein